MKKKFVSRVIWMSLVGMAFFAFQLPSILYGESPEVIDEILLPRFTPTPTPPEMVLTQRAFALMFFTPTNPPEPTQPFLAFLLPITGPTETLTPTASKTNTATLSATPTRTLLPVFRTQTEAYEGGGGGGGSIFTSTPFRTSTPVINPSSAASNTPGLPTATDEPPTSTVEVATDTPDPTNTPRHTPRPTHTDRPPDTDTPEPPPTATDEPPTNPPDPTDPPPDTAEPSPDPGGNSFPDGSATTSRYLLQFVFMYLSGATFLGVVFRRR